MKKYLAGGNAVGSTPISKEDCSQTNQAFSAMLANRDRQLADLWSTPTQQQTPIKNQNQIVLKHVTQTQNNKQVDINTVLEGDY